MGESDQRGILAAIRTGGLFVSVPGGVSDDLATAAQKAGMATTGFLVEPDGAALSRIRRFDNDESAARIGAAVCQDPTSVSREPLSLVSPVIQCGLWSR